jgi:hypothetical protein
MSTTVQKREISGHSFKLMSIGLRVLSDDCLQQKAGRIFGTLGSARPVDNQSLALLGSPRLPITILVRKLAHFFRSSLFCMLLLESSLYLPAYAMPSFPIVEGQHLHLVAVKKVSAARMQLPNERFSGPELPIAPQSQHGRTMRLNSCLSS